MNDNDAEKNKWLGVAAYIIFFIPLIADKTSEFGKYHANQGLNLLILSIAISIIGSIIPFIGILGGLLCFVLAIMGILNAYSKEMKELPVIGKFRLIK